MSRFNNQSEILETMHPAEIRNSMVTYEDMYNILYTQMVKLTRRHTNDIQSVEIWVSELRNEGYKILYEESRYSNAPNHNVFAIMSPSQKNVRNLNKYYKFTNLYIGIYIYIYSSIHK